MAQRNCMVGYADSAVVADELNDLRHTVHIFDSHRFERGGVLVIRGDLAVD